MGRDKIKTYKYRSLNKKVLKDGAKCKTELYDIYRDSTEDRAKRFNKDKLNYADLPLGGLIEVAKVTTKGREKYGMFNWQKGFPLTSLVDSLMRHLIGDSEHKGALTGERYDPETELEHFGHAAWNILAILHQLSDKERYKQFFDLPAFKDEKNNL